MKKISSTIAIFLLAMSFANAQSFVYLKNSAGLLTGTIVYEESFVNNIKLNAFCTVKRLLEGLSCEYVADGSPFANDPKKAIVLVNSKIPVQNLAPIQMQLEDVVKKLDELTRPKTQANIPNNNIN